METKTKIWTRLVLVVMAMLAGLMSGSGVVQAQTVGDVVITGAGINAGGKKITNTSTPTVNTDAATMGYVDSVVAWDVGTTTVYLKNNKTIDLTENYLILNDNTITNITNEGHWQNDGVTSAVLTSPVVVNMLGERIINVGNGVDSGDVVTSGQLTSALAGAGVFSQDATTSEITAGTAGELNMGSKKITNLLSAEVGTDATNLSDVLEQVTSASTIRVDDPDAKPVIYFKMNEDAANTVAEEFISGGFGATTANTSTMTDTSSPAGVSPGFYFDDKKLTYNAGGMTFDTAMSISFWIKWVGPEKTLCHAYFFISDGYYYSFKRLSTSNAWMYSKTTNQIDPAGYDISAETELNSGDWHLVSIIYEPGGTSVYVDKTKKVNLESSIPMDFPATINTLSVGGYLGTGYTLEGSMDDFRIYDYALTADDVAALYNGTPPGGIGTESIGETEYPANTAIRNNTNNIIASTYDPDGLVTSGTLGAVGDPGAYWDGTGLDIENTTTTLLVATTATLTAGTVAATPTAPTDIARLADLGEGAVFTQDATTSEITATTAGELNMQSKKITSLASAVDNTDATNLSDVLEQVTSASAIRVDDPDAAPLHYWKLNDNAASTVVEDAIGTLNLVSSALTSSLHIDGKVGSGALDLVGNESLTTVASDVFSDSITIALWMRWDGDLSSDTYNTMINLQGFTYGGVLARKKPTGQYFYHSTSAEIGTGNSAILNDGQWHHIFITIKSTTPYYTLWIDNSQVFTSTQNEGFPDTVTEYAFGPSTNSWNNPLDDIRIYDRVLSDAERAAIYAGGSGTEDTGSIQYDASTAIRYNPTGIIASTYDPDGLVTSGTLGAVGDVGAYWDGTGLDIENTTTTLLVADSVKIDTATLDVISAKLDSDTAINAPGYTVDNVADSATGFNLKNADDPYIGADVITMGVDANGNGQITVENSVSNAGVVLNGAGTISATTATISGGATFATLSVNGNIRFPGGGTRLESAANFELYAGYDGGGNEDFIFSTAGAGEVLRILETGDVGIDTINPLGYKLNVNGTQYIATSLNIDTSYTSSATKLNVGGGGYFTGDVYAGGVTLTCREELKTDITTDTTTEAEMDAMIDTFIPVSYNRKIPQYWETPIYRDEETTTMLDGEIVTTMTQVIDHYNRGTSYTVESERSYGMVIDNMPAKVKRIGPDGKEVLDIYALNTLMIDYMKKARAKIRTHETRLDNAQAAFIAERNKRLELESRIADIEARLTAAGL